MRDFGAKPKAPEEIIAGLEERGVYKPLDLSVATQLVDDLANPDQNPEKRDLARQRLELHLDNAVVSQAIFDKMSQLYRTVDAHNLNDPLASLLLDFERRTFTGLKSLDEELVELESYRREHFAEWAQFFEDQSLSELHSMRDYFQRSQYLLEKMREGNPFLSESSEGPSIERYKGVEGVDALREASEELGELTDQHERLKAILENITRIFRERGVIPPLGSYLELFRSL